MNDLLRKKKQKTTDPDIWKHVRARHKQRAKTIVLLAHSGGFSLNSSAVFKYRQRKRFDRLKSIAGGVGGRAYGWRALPERWLSIKAFHAPTSTHLCVHMKLQHGVDARSIDFQPPRFAVLVHPSPVCVTRDVSEHFFDCECPRLMCVWTNQHQ